MTETGLDLETLKVALKSIDEFADRELPDTLLIELDERDEFPEEIVRRMCRRRARHPARCSSPTSTAAWAAAPSTSTASASGWPRSTSASRPRVLATFLGSDPIRVGGTPEQKQRCLSRIAEEGVLIAYGATEPEAGSDLGALKTTAEPVERQRQSSPATGSPAPSSGSATAASPTSTRSSRWPPAARAGSSSTPAPRASRTASPRTSTGSALSNTAALFLDDVYVDADRLVGGVEGQGLVQAQQVFGYTRLMVAAFGLGAGWAALDRAIPYSRERIQAGAPLSEKQGYTHKLIVPHAVRARGVARGDRGDRRRASTPARERSTSRARSPSTSPPRRATRPPTPPIQAHRRLRLHARLHGREDQARRSHHHGSTRAPRRSWR